MELDDYTIVPDKKGASIYAKVSFPIRYGRYGEIATSRCIYQFNLNGEIKFIKGLTHHWPDPSEWLKRTVANDWVYYSIGGYAGVYEGMGEYYLPCFNYQTNTISQRHPFQETGVVKALESFQNLIQQLSCFKSIPDRGPVTAFLERILENTPETLYEKSEKLHRIINGRIPVLPPDTRHVDYDIIPIFIADGCLYNCGFCRVKSGGNFSCRSLENIDEQLYALKKFYNRDVLNYNSIFLGQHDALHAGKDLIEHAARKAYDVFELERSHMKGANLFMFGSVGSLLHSNGTLFSALNRLAFKTFINIGFESADNATLSLIKKPITHKKVNDAFEKMLAINKQYENIEVTANFIIGDNLPETHLPSIFAMVKKRVTHYYNKGVLYFSPFMADAVNDSQVTHQRENLMKFFNVKRQLPMPAFIYLIQRL